MPVPPEARRESSEVRLQARAKINLFLEIKGARGDGYHEIVTLFHEIGLSDEVAMRLAQGEGDVLRVSAEGGETAPGGGDNSCLRALDAFRRHTGIAVWFEIDLLKRIPSGAGLGGGSSDATAALRGANLLCGAGLGDDELERLAGEISSDAPFFVRGGAAVGRGRGTELERVAPFAGELWVVVAEPDFSISTEWAYGQVGDYRGARDVDAAEVSAKFAAGDWEYLQSALFNAFEDIVFPLRPDLKRLKDQVLEAGCRGALLCGSGSAVFGLCGSREDVERTGKRLGVGCRIINIEKHGV